MASSPHLDIALRRPALLADGTFSSNAVDLKGLSDEQLVVLLRGGSKNVMTVLFHRYYKTVLRVASKILRDHAEAEDLMQDVFLEIYRKANLFDKNRGSFKTWVLQMAYSRSFNRRRDLKVRPLLGCWADGNNRLDGVQPCHSTTRNNGLTMNELTRFVEQALCDLSEKQRETLRLAYFEGLVAKEIADRLGDSVASVRHNYYRGLDKLRLHFKLSCNIRKK